VEVKGEISELKNTINTMVDQLSSFAAEVTRVAREVGSEASSAARPTCRALRARGRTDRVGELDGVEPHVPSAQHRRRDEGRGGGRLSKKVTVDVKGEILELKRR
jgi:hypothetical protein